MNSIVDEIKKYGLSGLVSSNGESCFVDTERITAFAQQIYEINNTIDDDFDVFLKKALATFDENWRSYAGDKAASLVYELKNLNETRSEVLKGYGDFAFNQVVKAYESGEKVNITISDQFE